MKIKEDVDNYNTEKRIPTIPQTVVQFFVIQSFNVIFEIFIDKIMNKIFQHHLVVSLLTNDIITYKYRKKIVFSYSYDV